MDDIYTKKPEECAYSFTQHRTCEFFPCHKTGHPEDFNCLFCYCPLYTLGSKCGGNFRYLENGVKDCSDCLLPHGRGSYSYIKSKYPGTHGAGQEKPIRKETAHAVSFLLIITAAARGRPCRRYSRPDSQWARPSARWSGLYAPSPVSHLPCQPASALWCRPKT